MEVMLFLAISAALLAGALVAVGGKNAETQFSQSMRDVNSKVQSWMNDVSDGFPGSGSATNYSCTTPVNRPKLSTGSGSVQPECIFLGKALQFTTTGSCSGCVSGQSGKIIAYSIFGRRAQPNGELVSNMGQAMPIAATGYDNSGLDFTETYLLGGGLNLKSVSSTVESYPGTITGADQLIGFFNSLGTATASAANGSNDLTAVAYPLTSNVPPSNITGHHEVQLCLELTGTCAQPLSMGATPSPNWPPAQDTYKLCFINDNDNETATLTITSGSGLGPQTNLRFGRVSCP